tara:strand:+ start:1271 stop:1963 length:693 start_codon:yes stop_codon:yes gene_type:complete
MKKANIAIIPARFGSERIKNKNIKSFLGKPIIAYPIIACLKSKLFSRVIVSTNNKKISDISKKYGAEVMLRDKKFLSNNQTPVGDVIKDLVKKFKKDQTQVRGICCVFPTTPMIKIKDLKKTYKNFLNDPKRFIITVQKFSHSIQRSFYFKKNKVKIFSRKDILKRSQDLISAYHDAGQFYWGSEKSWTKKNILLNNKLFLYKLKKLNAFDLDNLEDWQFCEYIYRFNRK